MIEFDDIDWGHRRRFVRRAVRLHAKVHAGGRELPAMTENISPGGAFLEVDLPHDLEVVEAHIDLPNGKEMHVKARVCWRRPSPVPGVGGRGVMKTRLGLSPRSRRAETRSVP